MERKLIGYWRSEQHPECPDPHDLIDDQWDEDERHVVWWYLSSGTTAGAYMGLSPCRLCGKPNGALEYTDGVYQWPEGLAHYVADHSVRLPTEIVAHALAELDALDAGSVSLDWWLSAWAAEEQS